MQGLHEQYEALMGKLESLKSTKRQYGQPKGPPRRRPDQRNDSSQQRAFVEDIGNSLFDVKFLERCQECLMRRLTSRQQGATREIRVQELAEIVKDLRQCLREYISKTKLFVDSCSDASNKVSNEKRFQSQTILNLQSRATALEKETEKAKEKMNKALEQSKTYREKLLIAIKKRSEDKKAGDLKIAQLTTEKNNQQQKMKQLRRFAHDMEVNMKASKEEKEQEIAKFDAMKESLLKENKTLDEEKHAMQRQVQALEEGKVELSSQLQHHTQRHLRLKEAYQKQNRELKTSTSTIKQLKGEMDDLKSQLLSAKRDDRNNAVLDVVSTLEKAYLHSDDERQKLLEQLLELRGSIRTLCRIRSSPGRHWITSDSQREICIEANGKKRVFTFDAVLGAKSTPTQIYAEVAHLIQSAFDGHNVCLLSYGHKESGHTDSMMGDDSRDGGEGIVSRSLTQLFDRAQALEVAGWRIVTTASMLEVHNEELRDLLNRDPATHRPKRISISQLTQHCDATEDRVAIKGAQKITIATAQDIPLYVQKIKEVERILRKLSNKSASPRHLIQIIQISGTHSSAGLHRSGQLFFVSLAGSERIGAADSHLRSENGRCAVDRSLSALADVFAALQNKQPHIPYRNSRLTHLLEPCIGGKGKTVMLFHVCPSYHAIRDSLHTLAFAKRIRSSDSSLVDHDIKCHITEKTKADSHCKDNGHEKNQNHIPTQDSVAADSAYNNPCNAEWPTRKRHRSASPPDNVHRVKFYRANWGSLSS